MIQRRDKKRTASAKRIQAAFLEDNHIDIEEIPPKEEYVRDTVNKQLRVCAYCRVSTDEESQQSSYELQVQHYTEYINKHDNWTLVGVYADEGISGTSVNHRVQFLQMIQDAEDGKIDMIVTKSISRFARNTLDCISYVRRLKALKPPVGVFFEMNGYNTLDTISETFLTLLSTVAQGESEAKSEALKWSYRQRFKKGIPVNNMWAIMGYDTDENGKIFIIEKEAEIVRFMFTAYLEGKSTVEIAEALTMAEIPTPKGNVRWQPGTVAGMLHNEKYCGEMRMQKTVTVDMFSHKRALNELIGDKEQILEKLQSATVSEITDSCATAINEVNAEIEKLQEQMMELLTKRNNGDISDKEYEQQSQQVGMKIDQLLMRKEEILSEQGKVQLASYRIEEVTKLLQTGKILEEFDRVMFKSLVRKITVLSNKEIEIEFECGITVRETL